MGIFGFLFISLSFLFRKEKEVGFWLAVFLFGILFALGKYNPFYEFVYYLIPFLSLFRYPEKFVFISSIAAVFLVGFSLDALTRVTRERKVKISKILIFLILIFGITSALAVWNRNLEPQYPMAFLVIFSIAYVFFYYGKVKRNSFVALLLIMILLDLFIKDLDLLPLIDQKYYEEKPILMDIAGGSAGSYRIYSGAIEKRPDPMSYPNGPNQLMGVRAAKQQLYPLLGMIFGFEHVGGAPGLALDLKNHLIWYQFLIQSKPDRRRTILKRSNAKYWIDGDIPTHYSREGFPIIFPDRVKVFQDALPRAFLVPKMRVPEKGQILFTYYDESFDPYKEVLLSKSVEFKESARFKGRVEKVTYSPNHVTVKTKQTGNGFMVLLDTYLPGWTVKVDGQEQEILRAYGLYRAVQLGPGEHTLEFDYFPEGFKEGLVTSFIFMLILVALPLCKPIKRLQFEQSTPTDSSPENPTESATSLYK